MKIHDSIYGTFEITEPVLVDLMNSPEVQRLKGLAQYGLPSRFYESSNFSRYDHSVGTMLLLKILRAGLEEQVAGLLHDLSHTAFCHVTDYVFGDGTNVQDGRHKNFLTRSPISKILQAHGFKPEHIADHSRYPLLEQEAPELCADRLDYALREFVFNPGIKNPASMLYNVLVNEDRMIFLDQQSAEDFAISFLYSMNRGWAGVDKTVRQHLFAQALKMALQDSIITNKDLFKDDSYVLAKLQSSKNPRIQSSLDLLSHKFELLPAAENPDICIPRLFKHVDPLFLKDGALSRLSEESERYRRFLKKLKHVHDKGIKANIVPIAPLRKAV